MSSLLELITKTGATSVRELFARSGDPIDTANQIAWMLRDGLVRIEPSEGVSSAKSPGLPSINVNAPTEVIVEQLLSLLKPGDASPADFDVVPTLRTWRRLATT